MSEMGLGYGSEFHLMRFLGRHRQTLNNAIIDVLKHDGVESPDSVKWLDFSFTNLPTKKVKDQEPKGMDFLGPSFKPQWQDFWPDPHAGDTDREGVQTWDAVGKAYSPSVPEGEWLLVEAKSHESELVCSRECTAGGNGLLKIKQALRSTFLALGCNENGWAKTEGHWLLPGFYQIANRFAALHFLRNIANIPARLLFLYFLDDPIQGVLVPKGPEQWQRILGKLYGRVGFPAQHSLKPYVHYMCLSVLSGDHYPLSITPTLTDEE